MTMGELVAALTNSDDPEEIRTLLGNYVSDWLIAAATQENGEGCVDLEARWREEWAS